MTTYRTGNRIGSSAPKDLFDNAENADVFVNSKTKLSYPDRLGISRKTWHGMEQDFQAFLLSSGYQSLGDYAAGLRFTAMNQGMQRPDGFWTPKSTATLPYETTGDWGADKDFFVNRLYGDFRQDLSSSVGSSLVSFQPSETGSVKSTLSQRAYRDGITPLDFYDPAGHPDHTIAFKRWAELGGYRINSGHYLLKEQISILGDRHIVSEGQVTLDFSGATDATKFPNRACVFAEGGALTQLPGVSSNIAEHADVIAFASAPSLVAGDVVLLHNPSDFSFNEWRAYYNAGEFCEVAKVVGASVHVFGGVYAPYNSASINAYRLPRATFSVSGSLKIVGTLRVGFEANATLKLSQYRRVSLSGIDVSGSLYAAILTMRCYDVSGEGVRASQTRDAPAGTDYGFVVGNCQKVRVTGSFYGGRHAVTLGGDNLLGNVPCRDVYFGGSFENSPTALGGIGAANAHGNAEHFHFDGVFKGGWSGGGNKGKVSGTIISRASQLGVAIYLGEMHGASFDFSGCRISGPGDASGILRGFIDMGGSSDALTAKTKQGGVLDFSNCVIDAPESTSIFRFVNRGYVGQEPLILDMSNVKVVRQALLSIRFLTISSPTNGGKSFDRIFLRGIFLPSSVTYTERAIVISAAAGQSAVDSDDKTGVVAMTAATDSNIISVPVIFDRPFHSIPKVTIDPNRLPSAITTFAANPSAISLDGFMLNIYTTSRDNFESPFAFNAIWRAFA